MKKIELSYEGTVFNKIAGNEKKAMYYNEELNNMLIVTSDEKAEIQKIHSESIAEELKNGDIDDEEVDFDESNNIIVELDDEDFNDTIEDAVGYIVGDRWDDLCTAAEYVENTTILIHKPYYTTTDVTINYNLNPKELLNKTVHEAIEAFDKCVPENQNKEGHIIARCYKLVEIMGSKAYRYGEIPEVVFEAHLE